MSLNIEIIILGFLWKLSSMIFSIRITLFQWIQVTWPTLKLMSKSSICLTIELDFSSFSFENLSFSYPSSTLSLKWNFLDHFCNIFFQKIFLVSWSYGCPSSCPSVLIASTHCFMYLLYKWNGHSVFPFFSCIQANPVPFIRILISTTLYWPRHTYCFFLLLLF